MFNQKVSLDSAWAKAKQTRNHKTQPSEKLIHKITDV